MKRYRTGWISDVHLGTRGSQAAQLLSFLKGNEFEKLYLVGDSLDIWALRRGIFWPQAHNDVIQKILRKGRIGTPFIYIAGNHEHRGYAARCRHDPPLIPLHRELRAFGLDHDKVQIENLVEAEPPCA